MSNKNLPGKPFAAPASPCMLGYSEEERKACACAAFFKESEAEGLLREWFYANTDFDQAAWNKRTRDFFENAEEAKKK